jgi:hypothetical protein
LDKFAESLREAGYACEERLGSWDEASRKLKEAIAHSQEEKKIIFIDELSWMDAKESGLISALESFWNASHSCDGVRHMDVPSGKKKSACI